MKIGSRALQQLQHHQEKVQNGQLSNAPIPAFVHPDIEKIGAVVKDMSIINIKEE